MSARIEKDYHVMNGDGSLEVIHSPEACRQPQSTSISRITEEAVTFPSAYRVHFSIVEKNRSWMRGTSRSIRWVFGQPILSALTIGKVGRDCRGVEHEVELVWSKHCNKRRIYCDKIPVVCSKGRRNQCVYYSWKLPTGEELQITDNGVNTDTNQYQLWFEAKNFCDLPRVSELGRRNPPPALQPKETLQKLSPLIPSTIPDKEIDLVSSNSLGFRLSMAGFRSSNSLDNQIEDELHSALYSSVIDTLRNRITYYLPQTEELVSRAIINAFFGDVQSSDTISLSSSEGVDPEQVEVDAMWEAFRWKTSHGECFTEHGVHEATLRFMQRIVDDIFVRVRNEELDTNEAARVVFSVGAVLEFSFAASIADDSVILNGLERGTTKEELHRFLAKFGEVQSICFARSSRSFNLCRFRNNVSSKDMARALERGTATFGVEKPCLYVMSNNRFTNDDLLSRFLSVGECEHQLDDSGDDSTCVALPPTLDGSISSDGFELYDSTRFTWTPQTA